MNSIHAVFRFFSHYWVWLCVVLYLFALLHFLKRMLRPPRYTTFSYVCLDDNGVPLVLKARRNTTTLAVEVFVTKSLSAFPHLKANQWSLITEEDALILSREPAPIDDDGGALELAAAQSN